MSDILEDQDQGLGGLPVPKKSNNNSVDLGGLPVPEKKNSTTLPSSGGESVSVSVDNKGWGDKIAQIKKDLASNKSTTITSHFNEPGMEKYVPTNTELAEAVGVQPKKVFGPTNPELAKAINEPVQKKNILGEPIIIDNKKPIKIGPQAKVIKSPSQVLKEEQEEKEDAINNTIAIKKSIEKGNLGWNESNERAKLEKGLYNKEFEVSVDPKTGKNTLVRSNNTGYYDFAGQLNNVWDNMKDTYHRMSQDQMDKDVYAHMSDADKKQHLNNQIFLEDNGGGDYLPQGEDKSASAWIGKNISQLGYPLLKASAYGAGAATGAAFLGAPVAANAAAAELIGSAAQIIPNAKHAANVMSFFEDMAKSSSVDNEQKVYKDLVRQGVTSDEALNKAKIAGGIGAVGGGIGAIAMGGAFQNLKSAATNVNVQPFINSLKHLAGESVTQGGYAAGGSLITDLGAKAAGHRISYEDILNNAWTQGKDMAALSFLPGASIEGIRRGLETKHGAAAVQALGIVSGAVKVPKPIIAQAKQVVSQLPQADVKAAYETAEKNGILPKGSTDKIMSGLDNFNKTELQIPEGTSDEVKASLKGLQEKINELELSKSKLDKAYHPYMDSEIQKLRDKATKILSSGDVFSHETDDLGNPINNPKSHENQKDITIGDMLDKRGTYNEESGQFYQDGQTIIFKPDESNKIYEIGNVNEMSDIPASKLGIKQEESLVGINDNGNVTVRGKEYVNNYSDPLQAINRDKEGNIVSVSLETPTGQKRTFNGNIAEDLAYQINLIKNAKPAEVENIEVKTPVSEINQNNPIVETEEPKKEQVVNIEIPKIEVNKNEPITIKEEPNVEKEQQNNPIAESEETQRTSGVSHKALMNNAKRLGLKEPEAGHTYTPKEYKERGDKLLEAGATPDDINNKDFELHDRISIGEAHLYKMNKEADEIASTEKDGINSQKYKDKLNEIEEYISKNKKLGTLASHAFTALQGARDLDTGSFTSVYNKIKDVIGRDLTPEEQAKAKEIAAKNKVAEQNNADAEAKLIIETDNELGKENEPKESKTYTDKAKSAADTFRKLKVTEFTFKDENGNEIPIQKQGVSWNDLVEIGAKAIEKTGEIADGIKAILDEIKDNDWYKNLSNDDKKSLELQLSKHFEDSIKETPESKNIKRLEKELEDLRIGKAKQKNPSRELSEREKELKDEIQNEKEKLGLIKSKVEKPLTEVEKEQLDEEEISKLQEKYVDKKDNKFTTDESKEIWKYVKKTYLDKGIEYSEALRRASEDLGLTWEQVANAVVTPKLKPLSDDLFVKRSIANKNRQATLRWIEEKNKDKTSKIFKKIFNAPKAAMTFGHGHVFIGTHASQNLTDPRYTMKTLKGMVNAFRYAYGNEGYYEREMEALRKDPNFIKAQRAGLANDPDNVDLDDQDNYQSFVKKVGKMGEKGFNAVKVLRQQMFNREYEGLTDAEKQDDKVLKRLAGLINNWTGATNAKLPGFIKDAAFSASMEGSRWERLAAGPKAATYAIKGLMGNATPDQKAFAKVWFKRAGRSLGTYFGLLAANSAIQSVVNPDKKVNWTNPTKSDWLLPKFGNHEVTVDLSGGLLSTIGLLARLGTYAVGNEKKLPRGKSRGQAEWESVGSYLRGKLSPTAAIGIEGATGKDFNGNTIPWPWASGKVDPGKRKLGWAEYGAGHFLPLPLAEGFRVMQNSAEENGVSKAQWEDIKKGLGTAAFSGALGIKTKEIKDDIESPEPVEKVKNYKNTAQGEPITENEREEYDKRATKVYNDLESEAKKQGFGVEDDKTGKVVIKSFTKGVKDKYGNPLPIATKEEKYKEINRMRQEAAEQVKLDMFGRKRENVGDIMNKYQLKVIRQERKNKINNDIPENNEQ